MSSRGTTYDYTYEYDTNDTGRRHQQDDGQDRRRYQNHYGVSVPHTSRTDMMDSLANLQHDRIWHKLYDPLNANKSTHDTEIQKMARRQDRRVIKLEAAHGSDRQTFTVKRGYDLRVRDVQEDAAQVFRIPIDQLILYWKGRNLCDTPNELLETLGVENNHVLRVCRGDEHTLQNRRDMRSYSTMDQQHPPMNDMYRQQQQPYYSSYQQPAYSSYPTSYDQQQQYAVNPGYACTCGINNRCNCSCRMGYSNYYQQLTSPSAAGPAVANHVINLQIGFGDRVEGLAVGRPHPITVYDLQVELQQRFNIPLLEQSVSYNGMSLTQFPPDISLDAVGIINNSFISLWYKNYANQNAQGLKNYYSMPTSYATDGLQSSRNSDMSSRRMDNTCYGDETMQNPGSHDVLKVEVFHGSDRHALILRSTNNLRIVDLMEELQRITTVPVQNQKLYFRGQELQLMKERSLRDLGIDNNAQVRLIGDPIKPRYEALITGRRSN